MQQEKHFYSTQNEVQTSISQELLKPREELLQRINELYTTQSQFANAMQEIVKNLDPDILTVPKNEYGLTRDIIHVYHRYIEVCKQMATSPFSDGHNTASPYEAVEQLCDQLNSQSFKGFTESCIQAGILTQTFNAVIVPALEEKLSKSSEDKDQKVYAWMKNNAIDNQSIRSLTIRSVQRLPRIELLLKDIIKNFEKGFSPVSNILASQVDPTEQYAKLQDRLAKHNEFVHKEVLKINEGIPSNAEAEKLNQPIKSKRKNSREDSNQRKNSGKNIKRRQGGLYKPVESTLFSRGHSLKLLSAMHHSVTSPSSKSPTQNKKSRRSPGS